MKIRYSYVRKGQRYWEPTPLLRGLGFECEALGKDGPKAQTRALQLTASATEAKANRFKPVKKRYLDGSVAHLIEAYVESTPFKRRGEAAQKQALACFALIREHMGDTQISLVSEDDAFKMMDAIETNNGPYMRWHTVKAAKFLFGRAADRGLVPFSPFKEVVNTQPQGRTQTWKPSEVQTLIDTAVSLRMDALALAIRIMDETALAPVDVRTLTLDMIHYVDDVTFIDRNRSKTGKKGIWALPEALGADLKAYVDALGADLMPNAQILRRHISQRRKMPVPWMTRQEFATDFALVRKTAFGEDEKRKAMDIRRTVSVETDLAGLSKEERAAMLANNMDRSEALHAVYTPATVEAALKAMNARQIGREIRTETQKRNIQ